MKSYILKKDLPDSKAGDVYFWVSDQEAYYKDGNTMNSYWTGGYVENNPEWFEEVKCFEYVVTDDKGDKLAECINGTWDIIDAQGALTKMMEALTKETAIPRRFASTYDYAGSKASWDGMLERIGPSTPLDFSGGKNVSDLCGAPKLFTEEDLKQAFDQSRLTHPLVGFKYNNFDEYLKAISK